MTFFSQGRPHIDVIARVLSPRRDLAKKKRQREGRQSPALPNRSRLNEVGTTALLEAAALAGEQRSRRAAPRCFTNTAISLMQTQ